MTNENHQRLRRVFCEVFELEESSAPVKPEQGNIAQWDSLGHLRLIMAVEAEFHVRFATEKIPALLSLKLIEDEIVHVR